MTSSGVAIHTVSPSDSGPPIAKPMKPAACRRASGSWGPPDQMCHRPSTGNAIITEPRIRRGRASRSGSVRISTTATTPRMSGTSTTAPPITVRTAISTQPPTGRAASNHELAATITATPSRASAMPSRRCPGSSSRARPTERAVEPAPLASISQPARVPRPTAAPAVASGDEFRRGAGRPDFAGFLRGAAGRAGLAAPRVLLAEPAFDLVERVEDLAAVLLAMASSLVAIAPDSTSATPVTNGSRLPTDASSHAEMCRVAALLP